MMDHCDNIKCMLVTCVLCDELDVSLTCILVNAAKYECNHDDAVSRIVIRLKASRHTIPGSRIVIVQTIKGTPVCDVVTRIVKDMVTKLTVYACKCC